MAGVMSQAVILMSWSDATVGTVANTLPLGAVLYGWPRAARRACAHRIRTRPDDIVAPAVRGAGHRGRPRARLTEPVQRYLLVSMFLKSSTTPRTPYDSARVHQWASGRYPCSCTRSGGLEFLRARGAHWGGCGCQYGSGVHEPSEVGSEPGGGRAVDDVVVDGDGEVQDVSHFDAVPDRAGTFGESADNDDEGRQGGRGDGEASAVGEHADCGYLHRSGGEVDAAGAAHRRVHSPVQAGDPPKGCL